MEQISESIGSLIKRGNKSSGSAAIGNTCIAAVKAVAFAFTGSGPMFATMMHSIADAVNQMFVFTGSVLAEKRPTRRFPDGFGRVINLFCMVAVIVVTIMAYETLHEGLHLLKHPAADSHGYWINVLVLVLSIAADGFVWIKAMNEVLHDSRVKAKGLGKFTASLRNVKRAAPPTRLVYYEDLVATSGGLLAMIAILVTAFTDFKLLDGVSSILIAFMMIGVAFRVGYDNMVGLIGVAAPPEIEERVAKIILTIRWSRIFIRCGFCRKGVIIM